METLLNHFVLHLENSHDLSRSSISGYAADIRHFFSYISKEKIPISEITESILHRWIKSLQEQGIAIATLSRKISSLRQLFRFLIVTQQAAENLALKIHAPPRRASQAAYQVPQETLVAFEQPVSYLHCDRDLAAVILLGRGGLRVSEVISLQRRHLVDAADSVTVRVQGSYAREIIFRGNCAKTLRTYWKHPDRIHRPHDEALFPNQKKRPMTRQGMWRALMRRADRLGLAKTGPACLRCAFVQRLIDAGVDDKQIAHAAGLRVSDSLRMYRRQDPRTPQAAAS